MAKTFPIKAIITAVDKFSAPMKKIGKGLTAGLTLPIVGFGFAAVKSSTDFNASMANVATLIPGNVDRVNELKRTVQDLAIETGKSTEDLSGGLFQVISAFGDSADSAKVLEINAKAAAAGLATTTDAINLTSAVTKGYGDTSAAAVQKASDLAFVTNKLGQTTFPELAQSLGRVVPLSAELEVSQEELFGVMATATGVTGKASEVSTQLRGVLQSVLAPTKDMSKLIKGMGFESGKAIIQQRGLQGTLELIVKAAEKTKLPLQKFISSIEGQTLALALTGSQSDTFTQKLQAMKDVTGATEEAFLEQSKGVNATGFTMTQFTQKVAVVSQRLGDGLAPALLIVFDKLTPIIDVVIDLASGFSNLDPTMQTIITVAAALAASLGPILIVVGAIVPIIAAISAPVALAVAGFAAFAAIAGVVFAKWEPIKEFFSDLISNVSVVKDFFGFSGGPPVAGATGSGAAGLQSSSVSALPQPGANQVNGEIKVKFDNAPPGTRIEQTQSNQSALDVVTDLGSRALSVFGVGG